MLEEYFVYPAQLWAHKNHIGIIEALARINSVNKQKIHVAFVGSNKGNLDYLKNEAAKLGVKEQVHFLGFIPTEDLFALYKNAIGSLYMTFLAVEGLPPAESFVTGCPVIASRNSGLIEQVGEAGILVDPLDSNELADAMVSLKSNSRLRNSLIKKGYEKAKKLRK